MLVRTRPEGEEDKQQWLLIKERDEWARPGEADRWGNDDRSFSTRRTMDEIAAGKPGAAKPEPAKPEPAKPGPPDRAPAIGARWRPAYLFRRRWA